MYKSNANSVLKHFDFVLLDMLCLQVAFLLTYMLWREGSVPYTNVVYRNMAMFIELADIAVIVFFSSLKNVLKRGYYQEIVASLRQAVLMVMSSMLYLFSIRQNYSKSALVFMGAFYFLLSYGVRTWRKRRLIRQMKKGGQRRSLLIVTSERYAATVIANVKDYNYALFNIAGLVILDRDMTGEKISGIPVVSSMEAAPEYVCREWVDEVFVALPSEYPFPQTLVDQIAETGVIVHYNLARVTNVHGKKQLVDTIGKYTVLTTSMNHADATHLAFKRAMDVAGGLCGCIFTGLLCLFIAPIIYISSPGPIFFAQTRIGRNGKQFKMYKFRSMYMDAEARKQELMDKNQMSGFMFKMEHDPRIIGSGPDGTKRGIGWFLRATSLDEFPQFWSVLRGDMSLVGTRPPTVDEWEHYQLHHRARLAFKPGITGMWQVSGRSDITDFEEVVRLDTEYIQNWSLVLDIKILFRTVAVVLKREGSR